MGFEYMDEDNDIFRHWTANVTFTDNAAANVALWAAATKAAIATVKAIA